MSVIHAVDYLIPIGTFIGGVASVYGLIVRPRKKDHERKEKERQEEHDRNEKKRQEQRRLSDAFMYGVAPIEGVTDGALAAPVRLMAVENSMHEVVRGQSLLEKRMSEYNGTTKRIEGAVNELSLMVKGIVTAGVTTKLDLDREAHKVASIAAESQEALLDAINSPNTEA